MLATPLLHKGDKSVKKQELSSISIKVIQHLTDFDALRSSWHQVYQCDRYAQVFLSWSWLRGWLVQQTKPWFILAAYDSETSEPVAFLPLQHKNPNRLAIPFEKHICMAGNPEADYTGLVCLPEYETSVLEAFASYLLEQANWQVLLLRDVLDPRIEQLITHLQGVCDTYRYEGAVCPYVDLPSSWEEYLKRDLSTSQRKRLRKALRDMENDPEVTISRTTLETFEQDFVDFLHVYELRRGKCAPAKVKVMHDFARWGIETDLLRMFIFRKADAPLAGEMLFFDEKNQSLCGYQRGYDPKFSRLSPGHGAVAYIMRSAIEQGLQRFDFLRGDEGYKSKFGTENRWTKNFLVVRSRPSKLVRKILFSSLGMR